MEKIVATNRRDQFSNKGGFILACIGSAVGMANIWLFPIRIGQFGGAAFLIPYLIFVVFIGFTGVVGEITFGRTMGTGPLGAFRRVMEQRGKKFGGLIGMIPVIGSLAIAIGYAVVVGWIIRFAAGSITGSMMNAENSGAYFGAIAGDFGSIPWHIAALGISLLIMVFGIAKGIEKITKILMPVFFILFIILAIKVATLGGSAAEGYAYLFKPNWTLMLDPKTWVYALGQAFFSLSLAGSGSVVYGSYLSKKEDVIYSAKYIALFDTLAAILAAVVIIPAVFAFNIKPTAGPPLMFITMPEIFKQMAFGRIFAIIFFIAVFFAGITSLINLLETPIEALQEKFRLSRIQAVAVIIIAAFAVGIFIEGGRLGPWMDVTSIYIIPLGALLAGIMFFWVYGFPAVEQAISEGRKKPLTPLFKPLSKYVFCGVAAGVYILGIFYGGIG